MELVNGRIDANATVPGGGSIELRLTNGNIELEIPRNTSAEFSARVGNGTITLSNLALGNQRRTPTSVEGTLGGGNGAILLTTVNGPIAVRGL